ncbi:amino acid carrier protein [Candidatus Dependentiae bacterium]|nr:amino acid carrier protein [Candidatus Dependentiae bacterium]
MDINAIALLISQTIWGWPLLALFLIMGLIVTVATRFVQIRHLPTALKAVFAPSREEMTVAGAAPLSPFQAFLNSLGTATGNGCIAGMATAIYCGGPGSAFWLLIAGFLGMALRYAEVYLGTCFVGETAPNGAKGGPMLYLSKLPGGTILPYCYAFMVLLYGLASGTAMQANAIGLGVARTWGIDKLFIAIAIALFIGYALLGGAKRILAISDRLTPFKVAVFLISSLLVLGYNYAGIIDALRLIVMSAFALPAVAGGVVGYTVQQAMRNGFTRSLNANEAGLGVASLFFGATGSKHPVQDSILSMVSAFITNYCVCFLVALVIIASGVWNNGLQSTELVISAFETFFGAYAGYVVTFCAASFGLGCMISTSFLARECFLFLTRGRFVYLFYLLYVVVAFLGTQARVDIVWNTNDIINASLLCINCAAILYFLPRIARGIANFNNTVAHKQ